MQQAVDLSGFRAAQQRPPVDGGGRLEILHLRLAAHSIQQRVETVIIVAYLIGQAVGHRLGGGVDASVRQSQQLLTVHAPLIADPVDEVAVVLVDEGLEDGAGHLQR